MKNSLVSVIIPTFNRFECLFKAIESAINQTYPNIEIIVIDDNFENPELRKRINKVITLKYPKVRYLMPDAHLGGSFARNEGIKVALLAGVGNVLYLVFNKTEYLTYAYLFAVKGGRTTKSF